MELVISLLCYGVGFAISLYIQYSICKAACKKALKEGK